MGDLVQFPKKEQQPQDWSVLAFALGWFVGAMSQPLRDTFGVQMTPETPKRYLGPRTVD